MKIQVINHDGRQFDGDLEKIAEMLEQLDVLLCAEHDLAPTPIKFVPGATKPDDGWFELAQWNKPDEPGAVGYHALDPRGLPYGKVFRSMVPSGKMLRDPSGHGESTAGCFAHEFAEMKADRFANVWAVGLIKKGHRTFSLIAYELSDPCQDASFVVKLKDGTEVDCSDFVKQNYFNPDTPAHEATSYTGATVGPMTVAPGGYLIVAQEVSEAQILGRMTAHPHERVLHSEVAPAAWREAIRALPFSRSNRRTMRHEEKAA